MRLPKKPKDMPKKDPDDDHIFLSWFVRDSQTADDGALAEHQTLEAALHELERWKSEAEDAIEDGDTPQFRLYQAKRIPLRFQVNVTSTLELEKEST